jgi:hypothetical protein
MMLSLTAISSSQAIWIIRDLASTTFKKNGTEHKISTIMLKIKKSRRKGPNRKVPKNFDIMQKLFELVVTSLKRNMGFNQAYGLCCLVFVVKFLFNTFKLISNN